MNCNAIAIWLVFVNGRTRKYQEATFVHITPSVAFVQKAASGINQMASGNIPALTLHGIHQL